MQQSASGMELPLMPENRLALAVNGGGSPYPLSAASSEPEESEHARLMAPSTFSDDGRVPLIQQSVGRSRREKALGILRTVGGILLSNWYKFVIIAALITLIVLVSVKGFGIFGDILTWFKNHNGWAGWGAFLGMYTGMVAVFLPGVAFIMGAGFVFGFWRGLLAVWVGGAIGQALAFLLARYLLKDWVEKTIKHKWQAWKYIDKAIEYDGWKLVLIMRFSPIIPYNLLNIAMATTPIPFLQFAVVSAVGIIYECAVFCYFGSMADNITSIISGEAGPAAAIEWVMLGISIVMCVAGAVLVSYSIKRAVRRAQLHLSMQDLEREAVDDSAEVALDATFLQALQREGFARTPLEGLPPSPEFELRAVRSSELALGSSGSGVGGGPGLDQRSSSGTGIGSGSKGFTAGSALRVQKQGSMKAKLSPPPEDRDWPPKHVQQQSAQQSSQLGDSQVWQQPRSPQHQLRRLSVSDELL